MFIYFTGLCLTFLASVASFSAFAGPDDQTLASAVREYQSLQKELDYYLKNKAPDCDPSGKSDSARSFCSVKDLCSNPKVQTDNPFIYQNELGEKIINDNYYEMRDGIKACLKEKYSDEIKAKREGVAKKLGYEHLTKIMNANKKLKQLTTKFNEGAKIQTISSEILTMSIESGLKTLESDQTDNNPGSVDLNAIFKKAEKRTKTYLHPEVKKSLIELENLKSDQLYLKQVDKFEEDLIPNTSRQDPFFDWKQLTDEKAAGGVNALNANRAKLTQKSQDAYAIFQETQKEILDYLDSLRNESNSNKIDRIVERVKTISFNPPRLTKTLATQCTYPNAFYGPDSHSFTLCPQMLGYPKMAIMETMAHEIAHSFDSCNMSGKFYRIKGPMVVEEAPFEVDIKTTPAMGNFRNTRSEDPPNFDLKNRVQDKMLYADNPFSKTLSCLQDPLAVGARPLKLEELKLKAKEKLASLTHLGQNNEFNAEARGLNYFTQNEEDYFNYFQGCDSSEGVSPAGGSQMQEAFADKISSEIIARKLKTLSKEDAQNSFLQITLSYGHICANQASGETKLREFAIKEGCPAYDENMTNETRILKILSTLDPHFDPHPEMSKRIERNHLAHPEIRRALNCATDSGVKYCE